MITQDILGKIVEFSTDVDDMQAEDVLEVAELIKATMKSDGQLLVPGVNASESRFARLKVKDLLTEKDLLPLLPQAITHVLLNEIEPEAVIYNTFFHEFGVTRNGTFVIHNIGPMTAGAVANNGEYPEASFATDKTGFRIDVSTAKFGLQITISDEVIEDNLIGIIGLWLKRASNALVRNREKMAMDAIQNYGIITHDNSNPDGYTWDVKSYSGRGIDGVANGTPSLEDMMEMYVRAMLEGFFLDTLCMHPLAWQMFMTDPEMKEIVLSNNVITSFRAPLGKRAPGWTQLSNPLGLNWNKGTGTNTLDPSVTKLGANPWLRTQNVLGNTWNIPPRYFPTPLTIVVTPYVPFGSVQVPAPGGGTMSKYWSDLIFAQADECGLVLRKLDPITETFENKEKEYRKIRMKEIFGMAIMNQGKAIRIAKRAIIGRNYVFQNTNSVSLSELNTTTTQPSGTTW